MKTVLQILYGLIMGAAVTVVSVYLGLLLRGRPNWQTVAALLLLLAVTQWLAFFIFRRHIAIQVLLGLAWFAVFAIAWLYLGPFWERLSSPDGNSYMFTWRTALALVLLIAATQWISFLVFRYRTALPVFAGLVLCVLFAIPVLYSNAAFSWERHSPNGTFTVGWRSDGLFLLLLAATQGISFLTFRRIRRVGNASKPGDRNV